MPRVNRDLQRRMAARRERERRRPSGTRQYEFGSPQAPVESDDLNGVEVDEATIDEAPTRPARRPSERVAAASTAVAANRGAPRAHVPFSEFAAEYAYVGHDLRRVALVIGSLLAILIVLYFVLPH